MGLEAEVGIAIRSGEPYAAVGDGSGPCNRKLAGILPLMSGYCDIQLMSRYRAKYG